MNFLISYYSFISISVLLALFSGFAFNKLTSPIAIIILYISFAISMRVFISTRKLSSGIKIRELSFWSGFILIFFILFSLRAFLWVFFRTGDNLRVLSPNNLGDISLHINYINYFANGVSFWPDNTIFTGDKIRYPIGIDLFNSLLVLSGVDLQKSLVWVGLLSSLSAGFMLFVWGKAFALAGFLFNGGLVGFKFFDSFQFIDYQNDLAWKSLPLSVLVTQRGLLYAIPVGLLLLCSWRQRVIEPDSENTSLILPLWLEILFYSSMPIFHLHTFIFLSLLLLWFLITAPKSRLYIFKLVLFSIPLATFIILLLTNNFKSSSIIHLKWGWMMEKQNPFIFWVLNFGMFLPLVLFLCGKLFIKRRVELDEVKGFTQSELFVIPAVGLMILFFNLMMAPWEWDNIKLLIWSYIILLPYIWNDVLSGLNKIKQYVFCFVLFFSGFICICGGFPMQSGFDVFKFSEVIGVTSAVKSINIESRFAAFPNYDHPLLYAGRKVVLGYPGWLWSHGYKIDKKDEKLKALMMGDVNWKKYAKELGVDYIFWGEREEREYKNSTKPWEKEVVLISEGPWGKIFNVNLKVKSN